MKLLELYLNEVDIFVEEIFFFKYIGYFFIIFSGILKYIVDVG